MADEPLNPSPTTPEPTSEAPKTTLGAALASAPPGEAPKTETPPAGAPEKYADWKLPEGYTLDTGVSETGSKLFRELNLSQDQAQKLVDFYSEHAIKSFQEPIDAWRQTQDGWREDIKNDPQLGKLAGSDGNFGPDSPLVVTVNKALDGLQNPKLVSDFKAAMELTGAGNNPAFVKVLHALASKVTEGTTYAKGEPPKTDARSRPSAGAALYPNLPSGA